MRPTEKSIRGPQRKAYAVSRKHRWQGRNNGKAITTKPGQAKGTNRNPTHRKCSILLGHGNGDDGHTDDPQRSITTKGKRDDRDPRRDATE